MISSPSTTSSPELVLSPGGRLRLEKRIGEDGASLSSLDPDVRARIVDAFARGDGHGIFQLGSSEIDTLLPSRLAYWRELGRLFVSRLCAVSDLEAKGLDFQLEAPADRLSSLVLEAPPMSGGEYLSAAVLQELWERTAEACREEIAASGIPVEEFLRQRNSAWHLVGRVHFHLAERKKDPASPFAFLATYTTRLEARGKVQHLPLGRALHEYSGRDREALLSLLKPVQAAAEKSACIRQLLDSREIFHPLAWSARQAHAFLKDLPVLEDCGVIVKVPDWWKSPAARRPLASVIIGEGRPSALGLDALLTFSVEVSLGGEKLSRQEIEELLASGEGLRLIRGRWVEVDAEKLSQVLEHWKQAEKAASQGISFAESLRLLSGVELRKGEDEELSRTIEGWSTRTVGPWLKEVLEGLRAPGASQSPGKQDRLFEILRPYQRTGAEWLWTLRALGLGGCLADDMGLGKTVQILTLLDRARRETKGDKRPSLLIVPTSLISNWLAEVKKFTPKLNVFVAHASVMPTKELKAVPTASIREHHAVLTTYGMATRLGWLEKIDWDLVILDEAQAIKNPAARQTRAVKKLSSRSRFALTGTPVENRLGDLWSIFDFINPGLLGSTQEFSRFCKRLEERRELRFGQLRGLISPYILRRMKTDRSIISDLPEKIEVTAYCTLTREQAALYQKGVEELAMKIGSLEGIERRGVILSFLNRFKQICNHPAHWHGEAKWRPERSGKFERLREIAETVHARQEKILIFTQYREATEPLREFLAPIFGADGLVLHGSTAVRKRRQMIERFQEDDDIRYFVLSLKAGGTGLNLTRASHVVHFDRWWNPAVEDQASDRAYRIGQKRNVLVHKFVCTGTVEENVDRMLQDKRSLSRDLLDGGGDRILTELDNDEILELVSMDIGRAMGEG